MRERACWPRCCNSNWPVVGIALDLRSYEYATFYSDVNRGAFQMYSLRWIGGNEQPDIFGYAFSTARFSPKGNRGHYSNPKARCAARRRGPKRDPSKPPRGLCGGAADSGPRSARHQPLVSRYGCGAQPLSLAARFAPNLNAQPSAKKTGYAVIGLGRIAGHFMPGTRATTNSQITALVSGHRDKADRIAAEYGVPSSCIYSYENFDRSPQPAVDAVYVALPNSMHAEYTIRAAKAGKHVLCEKPMSTNVAEARAMIAACKAANVKLMIAYRCHYEPTNLKAVKHHPRRRAGPGAGHRERLRLQHGPQRMAHQQETCRRRPALRRRHLFAQCLPLSHRRRAAAYLGLCLHHRPRPALC
jgi:hypothetical protein